VRVGQPLCRALVNARAATTDSALSRRSISIWVGAVRKDLVLG